MCPFVLLPLYSEQEGSRVCDRIAQYSKRSKQPTNIGKTVAHVFYSQVKEPVVKILMLGQKLKIVNSFTYLGFSWKSKLSLNPTVKRCLENIQRSVCKLKWLRSGRILSKDVLRKFFFAYSFPHLAWIFLFFPFLPQTQQEAFRRKFRVAMRLVHHAPFVRVADLFLFTQEEPLNKYVVRYIKKRLYNMYSSDLGSSHFFKRYLLQGYIPLTF